MPSLNPWLAGLALSLPNIATPSSTAAEGLYIAHADAVLGTSFDLKLVARSLGSAVQAETVIRAEIERLTGILSSYQTDSEFCRWLAAPVGEAVAVSADLLSVLAHFDRWHEKTGGALNAAAEHINQLWQQAEGSGVPPLQAARERVVAEVGQTHWLLDPTHQTATRLSRIPLRLHTFTKSYILDRAASAALALPDVTAVVLNSGGDLVIRGNWTEQVAVANPRADAENDRPVAQVAVQNRAVATSGDYRRGVRIGADWFSHLVDPRTGEPASHAISATVIHPDAVTAGALATAFNVLLPTESQQVAATLPGTEYLIMTQAGETITSPGWPELTGASGQSLPQPTRTARLLSLSSVKDKIWNADQELVISLELSPFEGRYHRPFVAIWVEDQNHQPVRNLALWYNKPRWLPELRAFHAQRSDVDRSSITSATRSPGTYTLRWDGRDNAGQYVKQGKYTICIEAAREHGTYQLIRQEMDFNGKPQQQNLNGNVEIAHAALDYRQTK